MKLTNKKIETIWYYIMKELCRYSLVDWLEEIGITEEEFDEFEELVRNLKSKEDKEVKE